MVNLKIKKSVSKTELFLNQNLCLLLKFHIVHRRYHFIAYRQLVSWCWGWLGKIYVSFFLVVQWLKFVTSFPQLIMQDLNTLQYNVCM